MICRIYTFLFKFMPIKNWQAFLIKKHFSLCSECQKNLEDDNQINRILISPEDYPQMPDLWPEIKKKINLHEKIQVPATKKSWIFPLTKWKWATVTVILISVLILIPYSIYKKSTINNNKHTLYEIHNQKIILKSIKMDNQPAKTYFFQSKKSSRLIIWVQKND